MCPRCGQRLLYAVGCIVHGEPSDAPTAEPIVERIAHEHWTAEELDVLVELAERTDIKGAEIPTLLAERLGTEKRTYTYKSTKHTLARRGVRKRRYQGRRGQRPTPESRHHRRWSEEEMWLLESGELQTLIQSRSRCAVYYQRYRTEGGMREDGALSIREASATYALPYSRVQRMVARGILPAQRLSSRLVRIDPLDAERILSPLAHPLPAPSRGGVGSPMRAQPMGGAR